MLGHEGRSYVIEQVKEGFDWENIAKAPIDRFSWCYDYKPETYAQIVFLENREFVVRLTCFEKNPKAVYKNFGDPVWLDSCLEFFVAFHADEPMKYMNCEMNSAGAALMNIGTYGQGKRQAVDAILGHVPKYKAEVSKDRWSAELHLVVEDIKKLFGDIAFKKGYKFTGNMFKCGDETEFEHYGMWSRAISIFPQFHKPEYFGELIIG